MKRIGKKGLMGVALLTALSLFTGVAIANSTSTNKVGNTTGIQQERKRVDPVRLEELKKKLNTGKITKSEATEIIEILDRRYKNKTDRQENSNNVRNTNNSNTTGTQRERKKIDPARLEELKKKLNTGSVSKAEAEEIINLIDKRRRGNKPNGQRFSNGKATDKGTSNTN